MNADVRSDVPLGRRSPTAKCRVVVADKSVINRVGIRAILERTPGTAVIAEATSYDAVIDSVDEHGPDVLVIDLDLGDDTTRGLKLCEQIAERFPETKVLVLSATLSEVVVVEALRRGANGFLCKDELMADELARGVRQVQEGETVLGKGVANLVARGLGSTRGTEGFTDRELAVVQLVAKGLSNKQIAKELFITESTVKFHLQNSSKKLGAHRRAEIVHKANIAGLL
jgi:two-component system, NarL family, response regulator DevR